MQSQSEAADQGYEIPHELLEGVRTRRVLAFVLDYLFVVIVWAVSLVPVFFLGVLTLGLGFLLYPVLGILIAILYVGSTMGGPAQATWGMQFFSLKLTADDGRPIDFITAVVNAVLFWVIHIVGTPLLLVVSLFSARKKLLQDILLGTTVLRSDR